VTRIAAALVHYPVVDRGGEIITTAITNLDLHDMSRTACTYGVADLFIVHPVSAQRELAQRVRDHWVGGSGARRIPTREPAMSLVRIVSDLGEVMQALGGRERIDVYATSARTQAAKSAGFAEARSRMAAEGRSVLLLFGTGWGLSSEVVDSADVLLAPVEGCSPSGYNHLSVRAAFAIILDRLLGPPRAQ
jgi:hypothetical protein